MGEREGAGIQIEKFRTESVEQGTLCRIFLGNHSNKTADTCIYNRPRGSESGVIAGLKAGLSIREVCKSQGVFSHFFFVV